VKLPAPQRIGYGSEIAGHKVIRTIGRGGMGVVYLAEPVAGGEPVALKVLAPELAGNAEFRRRFEREAEYMRRLRHPHVVSVREAAEFEGLLYIAMQYIDGEDLSSLITRDGPLDAARAIDLLAQVAAALDAAHASGVVHRDVKPANVIVAAADEHRGEWCYVTDFGLSKSAAQDSVALTAADSYVGTFHYVAPEAFGGGACDHRADVYSLGCVLCECLTGAPPFPEGREVDVLYAHLRSPPPALSALKPNLPQALDEVLARSMAKDPAGRYASCLAMVHAARMAIGGEPAGSGRTGESDPPAAGLRLEVVAGNLGGTAIDVGDQLDIGRAAAGQGQLGGDPEISRSHARVAREPDGSYTVEDLDSTNGTFVNGLRITSRQALEVDDTLEVGGTRLRVASRLPTAASTGLPSTASSSAVRAPEGIPVPAVPTLSVSVDFEQAEVRLSFGGEPPPLRLGLRDGRWQMIDD